MSYPAFLSGFGLSFGLILAIGPQNAFVLRQGLRRSHVFAVVAVCVLSDAALIVAGVAGFTWMAETLPWLQPLFKWGGVAFLLVYGAMALRSAWRGTDALEADGSNAQSLWSVVVTVLALTWLNPHVYLDTLVLIGSVSTEYPGAGPAFAAGAILASALFFVALGYGARTLAPLFARPVAWRLLDLSVAVVMWTIAAKLIVT